MMLRFLFRLENPFIIYRWTFNRTLTYHMSLKYHERKFQYDRQVTFVYFPEMGPLVVPEVEEEDAEQPFVERFATRSTIQEELIRTIIKTWRGIANARRLLGAKWFAVIPSTEYVLIYRSPTWSSELRKRIDMYATVTRGHAYQRENVATYSLCSSASHGGIEVSHTMIDLTQNYTSYGICSHLLLEQLSLLRLVD